MLATSIGDSPTGLWNYGLLPIQGDNHNECADKPMLGSSESQIIISVNLYQINQTGYCHGNFPDKTELAIINKTDLIQNRISRDTVIHEEFPWFLSLLPVKSYGMDPSICLVSNGYSSSQYLWLKLIENKNNKINISDKNITLKNITYLPRNASQPDVSFNLQSNPLDTGDARILDASYFNGKMWIVYNTSCQINTEHPHTCIRLILLDNGDRTSGFHCPIDNFRLLDEKSISSDSVNYFYPSLQIDKNGNVMILVGLSSKDKKIYPSLHLINASEVNGKINLNNEINLVRGTHIANDSLDSECKYYEETVFCNRMGDYSSMNLDPTTFSIWTAGEYYKSANYSTIIAKISD